jgi:integral membrane protein
MTDLLKTNIGRLRVVAFLEGTSLILLFFVAVPLKYIWGYPHWSQIIGTAHGALFVLYILNTMSVASDQQWKFTTTTWKVLLASFIPFGTFYIDKKILKHVK